jgi:hypothetical protein
MESIVRNVRDLDAGNRQSLETLLGRRLGDDQQVMIRVVTPGVEPDAATKRQAIERVQALSQQGAQHREAQGISQAEANDAVDEAMEDVRQRKGR